jgi:hypothetical protein
MSSIKPPDSRVPGAASPTSGPVPGAEQRSGVAFDEALAAERARAAAPQSAGPASVQQSSANEAAKAAAQARGADPIAELAQAVRSGAVTAQQALDRLIERVAEGTGRHLSAAQRAELGVVLRSALQTDPALSALREALEG